MQGVFIQWLLCAESNSARFRCCVQKSQRKIFCYVQKVTAYGSVVVCRKSQRKVLLSCAENHSARFCCCVQKITAQGFVVQRGAGGGGAETESIGALPQVRH